MTTTTKAEQVLSLTEMQIASQTKEIAKLMAEIAERASRAARHAAEGLGVGHDIEQIESDLSRAYEAHSILMRHVEVKRALEFVNRPE